MVDIDYIFDKKTFDDIITMEFEGHNYLATAHYDYTLRASYGDYMTPLPAKERITHHSFKAYFK